MDHWLLKQLNAAYWYKDLKAHHYVYFETILNIVVLRDVEYTPPYLALNELINIYGKTTF